MPTKTTTRKSTTTKKKRMAERWSGLLKVLGATPPVASISYLHEDGHARHGPQGMPIDMKQVLFGPPSTVFWLQSTASVVKAPLPSGLEILGPSACPDVDPDEMAVTRL
jgi:hypothetical protein